MFEGLGWAGIFLLFNIMHCALFNGLYKDHSSGVLSLIIHPAMCGLVVVFRGSCRQSHQFRLNWHGSSFIRMTFLVTFWQDMKIDAKCTFKVSVKNQ